MMELPIDESGSSVPVFDCHVLISGPDADGNCHGVVSNLPEVTATARSERDLLRKISEQFKSRIVEYRQEKKTIPWESQKKPASGERQRWLPVHL
ncbi:hypothetical protein AB1L42_12255 [Thalassoglobus sp. JC818]|uniref:hypothetical protein n=1 Tax=Thalassoglobus sp. JC818 TaxID=3232136 RepID=UPI003458FA4A